MDDGDGGLSFDFEGGLDSGPTHPTASVPGIQSSDRNAVPGANNLSTLASAHADAAQDVGTGVNRRSFRQTVCRHWLRGLCMKGDACGFLHQYDKSRMPVCRFFRLYGECREQDCVYKHTNEDIKECNMYKLGFCPNGPDCRYRHTRVPGPPPPVEEVLQKIQQLASHNFGYSNRFFQNRNANFALQVEKTQIDQSSEKPVHEELTSKGKVKPGKPVLFLNLLLLPLAGVSSLHAIVDKQRLSRTGGLCWSATVKNQIASLCFGAAALGRGSGRGMAWPSMMPLRCGARPVPGMQGYTSGMMADGFSYAASGQWICNDDGSRKKPFRGCCRPT
nr:30-kDa cleavage and polyadenylation specificity factor 30-like [Ipomoea batatas]